MVSLSLRKIHKKFGKTEVIRGIDLDVADGEFVVFVGPSGCGKSTLLRMIAGLEDITAGEFRIGERLMNEVQPAKRGVAMVFQSYALYPHLNVRDNMAFGLKVRGVVPEERRNRVEAAAATLKLDRFLTGCRGNFPAGSASVSRSVARSSVSRMSSCSTSRFPISMPSCASTCDPRLPRSTSGSATP